MVPMTALVWLSMTLQTRNRPRIDESDLARPPEAVVGGNGSVTVLVRVSIVHTTSPPYTKALLPLKATAVG